MVGGGGGEQLQMKRLSKSRVFGKAYPDHNQYPQKRERKEMGEREGKKKKVALFQVRKRSQA